MSGFDLLGAGKEGRTVCPHCHRNGKRVVMEMKRLPSPERSPKGDRFPGQPESIPLVYHATTQWTCPQCQHSVCE